MEKPTRRSRFASESSGGEPVTVRRARSPLRIAMVMVTLMVIAVPAWIGLPVLSALGLLLVGILGLILTVGEERVDFFRAGTHLLYTVTLGSVAYAVFGLGLPSVITVYFPAFILLGAAHLLGARAALVWSVPSIALVAAAVWFEPAVEREVAVPAVFAIRAGTLATILGFAVSFRRSQDRQSAELERRATTDALTGLPNRRELDRALAEALGRSLRFARRGALVFVDLDRVKKINDTLGHAAGDALIQGMATRMAELTRSVDTPARLGGDEFVILLSEFDDRKGGEVFSRKLLRRLTEPCDIGGLSVVPSASIGVAVFPEAADNPRELLRLADDAMYEAKRAGGGRIYVRDGEGLREVV